VRWIVKVCEEHPRIGLADVADAAAALDALPHEPETSRAELAEICDRAGFSDAAAVFRLERLVCGRL
jgi:hypothetical protein